MSSMCLNRFQSCSLSRAGNLRSLYTSSVCHKSVTARYKVTHKRNKPLTYEMANPPQHIFVRKGFNSFNTSNLKDGLRPSQTAVEDMFIRKFVMGTWHNIFLSEIIIKRQLNMIRISGIISRTLYPRKIYFLIGYTEELLMKWLHCPIKMELQSVEDKKSVVFKYV